MFTKTLSKKVTVAFVANSFDEICLNVDNEEIECVENANIRQNEVIIFDRISSWWTQKKICSLSSITLLRFYIGILGLVKFTFQWTLKSLESVVGTTVKFIGRGGAGWAVMMDGPQIVTSIFHPKEKDCAVNTILNDGATGFPGDPFCIPLAPSEFRIQL